MKKSPSAGPPKGQKLCKNRTCKKVFSILDPHPSCTHCLPPRVCSRELPCEFCSPLSGEQWEEWERVLSKQKSYQARKKAGAISKEVIQRPPPPFQGGSAPLNVPVSTGISTEEVGVNGAPCRTPPPMTPASKKFNSFLAQAELDRASDKHDIKSMFSSLKSELFSSIKELTSLSGVYSEGGQTVKSGPPLTNTFQTGPSLGLGQVWGHSARPTRSAINCHSLRAEQC